MAVSRRVSKLSYLWGPVLFYLALIFFLSSFSFHFGWFQKTQNLHVDKVEHVVEYSLFGFLIARALWRHSPFWRSAKRVWMVALLVGSLYGATDEYHQSFVPYRDSSVYDWMADTAGVAFGTWIWLKRQKRPRA